jgi:hypothetical protein
MSDWLGEHGTDRIGVWGECEHVNRNLYYDSTRMYFHLQAGRLWEGSSLDVDELCQSKHCALKPLSVDGRSPEKHHGYWHITYRVALAPM